MDVSEVEFEMRNVGRKVDQAVVTGDEKVDSVVATDNVCGGVPCIRGTRIPVWLLESRRRAGATDERILEDYPFLSRQDLEGAWHFVASHELAIDEQIKDARAAFEW